MAPDDVLVYGSTALVPALTSVVCLLTLRAVHRKSLSVLASCLWFVAAVAAGMCLSFGLVNTFVNLLHGDGVLALVAAPLMGAMLTIPLALIFAVALWVIALRRGVPPDGQAVSERPQLSNH